MSYWADIPEYVAVVSDEDDDAMIVASGCYYSDLVRIVLGMGLDRPVAIHAVRGLPGVPSLVATVEDDQVVEVELQLAEPLVAWAF